MVDIYLFDCSHKLPSIGTVLMNPILNISARPPYTGGGKERRAVILLLFD